MAWLFATHFTLDVSVYGVMDVFCRRRMLELLVANHNVLALEGHSVMPFEKQK